MQKRRYISFVLSHPYSPIQTHVSWMFFFLLHSYVGSSGVIWFSGAHGNQNVKGVE